ncbi:ABC transporter permease [Aquamicrobium segne]|uniref:ABC transporter permease n=1 Tax=Aquamicrobium segne TaxID=469547 RepID=A0ABW0GUE7_9HYPH
MSTQSQSVQGQTEPQRRSSSAAFAMSPARETMLVWGLQAVILAACLILWEVAAQNKWISTFLFASPSRIYDVLVRQIASGQLLIDVQVTTMETVLGFIVGGVGGSIIGLALWYSPLVARLTRPFIAAVGSIPVLAVAPLIIIWFGTDITSKVVIVAFSCVVVSLMSSYSGAQQVDQDEINLMRSFGATRNQIFFKVVVPSSMTWVISGLKLNIGFALIGAIVGEYISSESGVGHSILVGSANFAIDTVLAGLLVVMILVTCFNAIVRVLERWILPWKYA